MRLLLPALLAAIVPGLGAQTQVWRHLANPRLPLLATWDSTRQCTVMVGQDNGWRMWEWDGVTLRERLSALQGVTDVCWLGDDPVHHRLVALDRPAWGSPPRVGTWDGTRWSWQAASPSAPIIFGDLMTLVAFDKARSRMVTYESTQVVTGVREWDGTQWWSVPGTPGPSVRTGAAFAYDEIGQRCVLYGGYSQGPLGDCWGWDGSTWTLIGANAAPGARYIASMAFSPALGGLLLYGGFGGGTTTWYLAGQTWVQLPTAHDPGPTPSGALMVQDTLGTVLLDRAAPTLAAAWRFAGGDWARVPTFAVLNAPSHLYARTPVAFDRARGQMVVTDFDNTGLRRVLLFDSLWHSTQPTASPVALLAMCWSSIEQQVVTFGSGMSGTETWNWTGTDWVQRAPMQSPPLRSLFGFVEDANGGVMLFGGTDPNGVPFGDQWHWNGAQWTQVTPATLPPPRHSPAAALDEARQTVVMVGGLVNGSSVGFSVWQWNGTNWTQTQPSNVVLGSDQLAFDPRLGRVIAQTCCGMLAWSGTDWSGVPTTPPSYSIGHLVSDSTRQRVLGLTLQPSFRVQELTDLPSSAQTFGNGCALGSTPALHAMSNPTPGNAAFAIDVGTLAPSAPTFLLLGLGAQNVPLGSGCALLVAQPVATLFAMAPSSGQFRHAIPIPNTQGLRGVQFVAQGAVLDPLRSPLGSITVTAGLRITIGD